jgi:hypothetical protein
MLLVTKMHKDSPTAKWNFNIFHEEDSRTRERRDGGRIGLELASPAKQS